MDVGEEGDYTHLSLHCHHQMIPYIVCFFQLYELIAYKLQLVDEHITILCIFILS